MMLCPECHNRTMVLDSRADGKNVRRRRECKTCRCRFETSETLIDKLRTPVKRRFKPLKAHPVRHVEDDEAFVEPLDLRELGLK